MVRGNKTGNITTEQATKMLFDAIKFMDECPSKEILASISIGFQNNEQSKVYEENQLRKLSAQELIDIC